MEPYVKDVEKRALVVAQAIINPAFARETGYNYMSVDALAKVFADSGELIVAPPEKLFWPQ